MALTALQLQDMLDQLDVAIATGATRVSYTTGTVEYRSLAEMLQVRDRLASQLAGQNAVPSRRTVAAYQSGF